MKVLVIGDGIIDHYLYGQINRQSPEDSSIPVVDVEREEYRLGGAFNVAANIRSISQPRWYKKDKQSSFNITLSSIFSRFTGQMLYDKLIQCDDSCLIEEDKSGILEPSNAELIKTRVIDQTGKQLLRIDNRKRFSDDNIAFFKENFGDIYPDIDAVIVSDYKKGLINGFVLDKLKTFKGIVFVDSKNPDLARWDKIKSCIIKVNDLELKNAITSTHHPLVVTRGKIGADWYQDNKLVKHFKVNKQIDKPDVVGAGDVFLAGLVVDYMRHKDLLFAIEFANMCASISVKQQGTTEVRL